MEIDNIFIREYLEGDQSTSTINNFDDYLDSLLNPFNNLITSEVFLLNNLNNSINPPINVESNIINNLQIEDINIKNKYTFIEELSDITIECNEYINSLTTTKTTFNNILNNKALANSPLTRPTLKTVLDKDSTAITRGAVNSLITSYTLPTPIPNTKLYVNRTGNGFIWA